MVSSEITPCTPVYLTEEAIEIVLKELCFIGKVPEIPRSAKKKLLRVAITNVHFQYNKIRYMVLTSGHFSRAVGLYLAVFLASLLYYLWKILAQNEGRENKTAEMKRMCNYCNRSVSFQEKDSRANIKKKFSCKMSKDYLHAVQKQAKKMHGIVPIAQKKILERIQMNYNYSTGMW